MSDEVSNQVYFPEACKSKRLSLRNVRVRQRAIAAELTRVRVAQEMPSSERAVKDGDEINKIASGEDDEEDGEDEIEDWSDPIEGAQLPDARATGEPKPLSMVPFFRSAAAMEEDRKAEEMGQPKRFRPVPELQEHTGPRTTKSIKFQDILKAHWDKKKLENKKKLERKAAKGSANGEE